MWLPRPATAPAAPHPHPLSLLFRKLREASNPYSSSSTSAAARFPARTAPSM